MNGSEHKGMGQKAHFLKSIPLCVAHHLHGKNSIHGMGVKKWEQKYGSQEQMLERTQSRLANIFNGEVGKYQ
jgi:hypothetical protein